MAETFVSDDRFRAELLFEQGIDGRPVLGDKSTLEDYQKRIPLWIDNDEVQYAFKATPTTDSSGNPVFDENGYSKPRPTTLYDSYLSLLRQKEAAGAAPSPADDTESTHSKIELATLPPESPRDSIPILCHQEHMRPIAVCRICSVLVCNASVDTVVTPLTGGEDPKDIKPIKVSDAIMRPACQFPIDHDARRSKLLVFTLDSKQTLQMAGQTIVAGDYVRKRVGLLTKMLVDSTLHLKDKAEGKHNELAILADRLKVPVKYGPKPEPAALGKFCDSSSSVINVDHSSCIVCDRCVRACSEIRPFQVIGHTHKGAKSRISFDLDLPMVESSCVSCGTCAESCPTGALTFKRTVYGANDPWADWPTGRVKPRTMTADELKDHELFRDVSYKYLEWNVGSVGELVLEPGEVLCRQGENGTTAFYIERDPNREGRVQIDIDIGNGQKRQVFRSRADGDEIIGEIACLNLRPRTASMTTASKGRFLVLKRNMVQVLQRNRRSRERLSREYLKHVIVDSLTAGKMFDKLSGDQKQACVDFLQAHKSVKFVQYEPKQPIFREGDPADRFYIVYNGFVKVSEKRLDGSEFVRDYMGTGRHFGEIALLSKMYPDFAPDMPRQKRGRRTGACTALDHVGLAQIPEDAFREMIAKYPDIGKILVDNAKHLNSVVNPMIRRKADYPLDTFTEQGLHQGKSLLVIDLEKCTRCQECVRACSNSHQDVTRLVLTGARFENYLIPSACRSCNDPVCLIGCPVDAIHREPNKTSWAVRIDDKCIGCSLCAHNCPFGSIHMHGGEPGDANTKATPRKATNCDLCESIDAEPRCVYACPHDAAHRMPGYKFAELLEMNPLDADESRRFHPAPTA